jgi:2-oxo-4-hydroxy-4-carboxy--5-ureidoimidazoline (OHCU) decarboxylase
MSNHDQNDWAFHIYTMAKTGKIDTNSFAGAMVHTYSKADSGNREAINEAFPALAQEWACAMESHAKYIAELDSIAKGESSKTSEAYLKRRRLLG